MATSGTIDGGSITSYGDAIASRITWKRNSYSVENNSSSVTVSLSYKKRDDSTTYGTGSWKLTINGTAYMGSSYVEITNSGYKTVFSKTVTIKHNADGTKSFAINASGSYIPGTSFTNTKCSGTAVLDTIAQASTISVTNSVPVGGTATLTITAKSNSFYHTATWKCGSATSTVNITTAGSSKPTFTIPTTWANQMPSSTSGTASVTVQTYSDSGRKTKIGSAVSKTFTVTIPSSYVPSGTLSASYSNTASLSGTTYYLQNKTKVTLSVASGNAGTGSTLKSYTFKRGSTTIKTVTTTAATASYSEVIPTTGSVTYSVVITDNRGRTTTKTATAITVYAYAVPTLTVNSCWRSDSSGTMNKAQGKFITVNASFGCSNVNSKNTASCTVKYKKNTATSWSSATTLTNNTNKIINGGNSNGGIALENTYDVLFTVTDTVGSTTTKTITVPTSFVTMDFKAGGTGVAIGKIATEDNLFDVGVNMRISNAAGTQAALAFLADGFDDIGILHSMAGNFGFFNFTNNTWLYRIDTNKNAFLPGDSLLLGESSDATTKDVFLQNSKRKTTFTLNISGDTGLHDSSKGWIIKADSNNNVSVPNGTFSAPKSIVHGAVSITPSAANTPTSKAVTWSAMAGTPHIALGAYTGVPGTQVTGIGFNNPSATGCSIVITRTNTSGFTVNYIAIY